MTRPPVIRVGSSGECPLVGAMRGLLPITLFPDAKTGVSPCMRAADHERSKPHRVRQCRAHLSSFDTLVETAVHKGCARKSR